MTAPPTKVLVLYTGGTLGMTPADADDPASPLVPRGTDELRAWLPRGIDSLGIDWSLAPLEDLRGGAVAPLDSCDVGPEHWRYIAAAVGGAYDDYDGFVILHGTDTMAFTASALSFMLVDLGKPVVVTGSQLPLSHPRTDAVANFVNALVVAGATASGLPVVPEVVVVFADLVLRGNRTRKMSSERWRAFESPNYAPLGRIGEHVRIDASLVRAPRGRFRVRLDLEANVVDVALFPGIRARQLELVFGMDGVRGVVLRTFGTGNAPSDPALLDAIGAAVSNKIAVVSVTSSPEGRVEAGRYATSSGLVERGVLSGIDMTPEAALTKLMWLLANEPPDGVAAKMRVDLAGEISA